MFGSRARIRHLQERNNILANSVRRLRAEIEDAKERADAAEARTGRFANDRVRASRADATEMAHLGDEIKKLTAQRDEAVALTRLQAAQLAQLQAVNEQHYQDMAGREAS